MNDEVKTNHSYFIIHRSSFIVHHLSFLLAVRRAAVTQSAHITTNIFD
jgi:hypothetical protein